MENRGAYKIGAQLMLRKKIRRILLTVATILIPVAGITTLGIAGTAGAAGKMECTGISGSVAGFITLSGCTGPNTGGGSQPLTSAALANGGTFSWLSGGTTTVSAPTLTTTANDKKCPGYSKTASSNPSGIAFTSVVTGDTGDGILIPGAVSGDICVSTTGNITPLKAIAFSWTSSDISCSTLSGTAASITVSGCGGGDTGGGSQPINGATLALGGTIDWLSGGSTTIGPPVLTTTANDKHCPGYSKTASSNPTGESFTASVTSDTGDGLKLPGSAKGAICISTTGAITALKPLSAK
jgi:hypothetical protein